MESLKFYTRDQNLRFMVDDALFSDSKSARVRAVNQLARDYGLQAIAVIGEIVKIVPATDEEFKAFCVNVIGKIQNRKEMLDPVAKNGVSSVSDEKKLVVRNLYLSGIGEEFIAMQLDLEIPIVIAILNEFHIYQEQS